MSLVCAPLNGGAISTRTFIPHRVHEAVGVLGAVSVATACAAPGTIAAEVARLHSAHGAMRIDVEHPTGYFTVELDVGIERGAIKVQRSALLRTARKLMQGNVFVPSAFWSAGG
jgi:4-oxalomesaconate tautomerase